jgi:hypothetical protein
MYWSLWDIADNGEPLLENVPEEWVDNRVARAQDEIVFEAELVTE